MLVADLRHFLDLPDNAPAPARRLAAQLTSIVRAGSAGDPGSWWTSALPCGRRPAHRLCPGHLAVLRTDVPPSIEWQCASCTDAGVINGWERSPFDLRARTDGSDPADMVRAVIPSEVAATLRSLLLLDTASERLIFRARAAEDGIVLDGTEQDLDELLGDVAAEANHEQDRRRRQQLDAAFEALSAALARARPS